MKKQLPTNRKFGWFFAAVFGALAAYAYFNSSNKVAFVALAFSIIFAILTLSAPKSLAPLNRIWYEFGMLLGGIFSPIVLGAIFFLLITPVSLVTKISGRDELKIKKRNVDSYWIDRLPPGPSSESFKVQY